MTKVKHVKEKKKLASTSLYPEYAKFPFDEFNPPQTVILEHFDKDVNFAVAASTSAGKTICGEMFLANEIRVRGGKGMYLGTHKALVQEKLDDWTNPEHHFSDLNISICSGDYQLTDARKKELETSNLITMTSEMLSSRCRNFKSEKNNFLTEIGTIVADEGHLLGVNGRGDHLEVALMKLTEINPNIRIVLLSATMPNVSEICEWMATRLNKKETLFLNSEYRPCPLDVHYPVYDSNPWRYDMKENNKILTALDIVESYPNDKFLIFAHTKATGNKILKLLQDMGIKSEFHNADLSKEKRIKIESDFKTDKDFRCMVATSTVAWGLNLPARRVILLGVHRGLDELETYDIKQMIGRAGRPKYDKKGDAYILVPSKQKEYEHFREKIESPTNITSQLLSHHKVLGFHLVSEIYLGNIKNKEDVNVWFNRSLASHQAKELKDIVAQCIEGLLGCGAIVEEDGFYKATSIGKIASLFYYSPFDVSDLKKNFSNLFKNKLDDEDSAISIALGNVDSQRGNIVSNAEKEVMSSYCKIIQDDKSSYSYSTGALKAGYAYYNLILGNSSPIMSAVMRNLQLDFDRMIQVLQALDTMSASWDRKAWFNTLATRVRYGVPEYLIPLITIPEIGGVRARKLYSHQIRNAKDVVENQQLVRALLNMKPSAFEKVLAGAKAVQIKNMFAG